MSFTDGIVHITYLENSVLFLFSDDTIFPVFGLADEYQVEILMRKCENYLLSKCKEAETSVSALVNILVCAETYNIKDLYNASFDRVSKCHPDDVKSVSDFTNLTEETRGKFTRLREQALDVKLTGIESFFDTTTNQLGINDCFRAFMVILLLY